MVVIIGIFEGSLNSDSIYNHIIHTIKTRLGLKIENFLTSITDRASTNKSTLSEVTTNF